jgi:hypothetical protein
MGVSAYGRPSIGYVGEDMLILVVVLEVGCGDRHSALEKMNRFGYKFVILRLRIACIQLR